MTIDANGEVIDVTPPPDFPMPAAMMKDMLKQALGLMARQEMAVGETVSAPFAMAMPLPMPGDPPQLKGELKSTLTGVTGPAGSEIAALEQVVTAGVDSTMAGPGGSGDITIKMQVTGTGHERLGREGRPGQGQQDDHQHLRNVHDPRRRGDGADRHHHRQPRPRPLAPRAFAFTQTAFPTWPTFVRSLLSGPARVSPRASPPFPTTS